MEKGVKAITLRWVRTWKLKEGKRVVKSRLVARGFQDSRNWSVLETYSGTVDASLARVAFLWAVLKGLQAAKIDVSTAFLQVPMKDVVWLRLPSNLPVEVYPGLYTGVFVRIQRAVYGLKDTPKVYTSYFKKKVSSLGWTEIAESILVRKNKKGGIVALLVMHVDDLFIFSPSVDEDVKQIQELFDTDQPERMDNGELHFYVGMSIWMRPGEMLLDQSTYIEGMVKGVSEKAKKPLTEKDLLLPETAETDMSLQEQQQKNMGCLGWAVKTQPSLSFLFSHLSRFNSRPSCESVLASEKALWHAFKTSRPLSLHSVPSLPVLLVWEDAFYQLHKKEGRLGVEIQLVDEGELTNLDEIGEHNTVYWLSRKIGRKLGSTTSAELLAMRDVVKMSWSFIYFVRKLWDEIPPVVVVTDSQPLMHQIGSKQCKSEPRMQGELEYVLENLMELGAKVHWIKTGSMHADRQTKLLHCS
uniref:Reverse transcriptase Ty1/copia-type domain-containing protein n=1 Tax=Chromera velia CCMP2878 TaxID=1169474 RepID=A0A0G4HBW3_9ALVE|eukprot:Cvel_6184.t1-p1 / transcript=Cvel_6184.t1 / gene=Cvel_6184 / organism=Chromera_velia_CCMP2878 / gene_product=Copia protein, putative / transcript_product=Copia protein, putative / location=Cvel_scaffold299:67639-69045(+) / protein_length=469 / sequence_SO=supercontig / SO=protein_coding / is_pseudo=false